MTKLDTLQRALKVRAAYERRMAEFGVPTSTGNIGEEIIAALYPTWKRMPPLMPGYDFIDDEGRRVSVKTWASGARKADWVQDDADRFIRVVLTPDGGWEIALDLLLTAQMFVDAIASTRPGRLSILIYSHGPRDRSSPGMKAAATKRRMGIADAAAQLAVVNRTAKYLRLAALTPHTMDPAHAN
jgi:hypothetical protein